MLPLRVCAALMALLFSVPAVVGQSTIPPKSGGGSPRDSEPVVLQGAAFADLLGEEIGAIRIYYLNAGEGRFDPIPFQVDERIAKVFNEGNEFEFSEVIYDVLHEEDGLFDANDEIAFMYEDAGVRAPAEVPWPDGAGDLRYEIAVDDPRPGSGSPLRYAYLFTGVALPLSELNYVSWNLQPGGAISSEAFELGFEDRWLLTEYRVLPPCGDGSDLIDRVKGRAAPLPETREDEEGWNTSSTYLGGLVGPIRAIRYVRGATSAINTIHHDLVYRNFWTRAVNLRVHALARIWFYIDWLPRSGTELFTPDAMSGVPIDGVADTDVGEAYQDWQVVAGPGGGLGLALRVPDSNLFEDKRFFYRDDENFNDQIPTDPDYGDDDDSAYGAHGVTITGIENANTTAIPIAWRVYPICSGDGDGQLGETLQELTENPLQSEVEPQWSAATLVRTLRIQVLGADLKLEWDALPEIDTYRVYSSASPAAAREQWSLLSSTHEPFYLDQGEASLPDNRFYSIVGITPGGGEGGW